MQGLLYPLFYPESLVSSLLGINSSIYVSSFESNHYAIHVTNIVVLKTVHSVTGLGLGLGQKMMCLGFRSAGGFCFKKKWKKDLKDTELNKETISMS